MQQFKFQNLIESEYTLMTYFPLRIEKKLLQFKFNTYQQDLWYSDLMLSGDSYARAAKLSKSGKKLNCIIGY